MTLNSIQSKILIVLISVLSITAIVYFFTAQNDVVHKITTQNDVPPKVTTQNNAPRKMTVQEKKARFKKLIIPAVNTVYEKLMIQYQEVSESIKLGKNADKISKLKAEYKATDNKELLIALKPHPKSIAIAQAAMESSWATSRFFNQAYNIFGVWSFDKNEPRIAALQKRSDKTIWVKKYSSIEASVYDYYRILARGSAFKEFRQLKWKTNDPYALVKKLDRYSEKGAEYGHELTSIIKFNKFNAYD